MHHFQSTHGVRLGLSDLKGGTPRTMADLIAILSVLPQDPTRVLISKIQILLANEDEADFEYYMRKLHLAENVIYAVEKFGREKKARVKLFTEMPLLLVQEVFREYHGPETSYKREIILEKLLEAIFIANDICNTVIIDDKSNISVPDTYSTFALPEILFNYSDQFRYAVGRSFLIYEGLKARCQNEFPQDYFDVDKFFRQKIDIPLDDYFFTIFTIFSNWGTYSFKKMDDTNIIINTDTWISEVGIRNSFNKVLNRFESPWLRTRKKFSVTTEPHVIRAFLYEHFHLRKAPLLRISDGVICGSLLKLMSKYWDGPYYEVIENGSEEEKKQFFRFLGRTTEMYVQDNLQVAFKSKFKKISASSGNPIADAAVLINPNWCLLFEVKAKRPTKEMISSGDAPAEMEAVAQMAFEGLEQMNDRIQEYRNDGFKGRITPILITGGLFPINSLLWKHYLGKIMRLSMMNDSNIDLPQFMNLEAIEILTALTKICRIGDLLRNKLSEDWKAESFQTFLFSHYFPENGIKEIFNPTSRALYEDRMAALMKSLFPDKQPRVSPNKSWFNIFKIPSSALPQD